MVVEDMPGCCAGKVFYNLDNEYDNQHHAENISIRSLESREADLVKYIGGYKQFAFIMATTNSNQKDSEALLVKHGFRAVEQMPSKNHPELTITIWIRKNA